MSRLPVPVLPLPTVAMGSFFASGFFCCPLVLYIWIWKGEDEVPSIFPDGEGHVRNLR